MTGLEKPNEEASIADHKKPPKACPEAGLFGRIVNRMGIVFSVGILVSAGILFVEVVMRYVFNSPTTWAHETVVFLNACAFIFGGLYVAAHNKHIRVVLVYSMIPDGPRRYLDAVISFVCMVSTGFFRLCIMVKHPACDMDTAGTIPSGNERLGMESALPRHTEGVPIRHHDCPDDPVFHLHTQVCLQSGS